MTLYEVIKLSTIEKGEFWVKQKSIDNLLLKIRKVNQLLLIKGDFDLIKF